MADDKLRTHAEGPPPARQGPLQRHVGGHGDLDVGDSRSGCAVPHLILDGTAGDRRKETVERVQSFPEDGVRPIERLPHAVPLGPHAGEDEYDGRGMGSGSGRLEPVGHAAGNVRLEASHRFFGLFEDQGQAVIEMGPVQRERRRNVGGRYFGAVPEQGDQVRCFLLQCVCAVGGQDENPGVAPVVVVACFLMSGSVGPGSDGLGTDRLGPVGTGSDGLGTVRLGSTGPGSVGPGSDSPVDAVRFGLDRPGRSGCRRGTQHHVGVGAAEAEGVDPGVTGTGEALRSGDHAQPEFFKGDVGIRPVEMQGGRKDAVLQRKRRLDEAGDPGRRLGMADVGLHRPDQAA